MFWKETVISKFLNYPRFPKENFWSCYYWIVELLSPSIFVQPVCSRLEKCKAIDSHRSFISRQFKGQTSFRLEAFANSLVTNKTKKLLRYAHRGVSSIRYVKIHSGRILNVTRKKAPDEQLTTWTLVNRVVSAYKVSGWLCLVYNPRSKIPRVFTTHSPRQFQRVTLLLLVARVTAQTRRSSFYVTRNNENVRARDPKWCTAASLFRPKRVFLFSGLTMLMLWVGIASLKENDAKYFCAWYKHCFCESSFEFIVCFSIPRKCFLVSERNVEESL